MDNNTEARWTEVKAWFICQEILKNHNNIMELLAIVDGLAAYGDYPSESTKMVINELLTYNRYKPNEEEYILLLYHAGVPLSKIKKITKKSGKTLYKIFNSDKENPRGFYPRFVSQQTELLTKFVKAIEKIGACYSNVN